MSEAIKQSLVAGGNGQFGIELTRYAWPEGWAATATGIDELDLPDTSAMVAEGHDGQPWAAAILAGAYTAADHNVVVAWASTLWLSQRPRKAAQRLASRSSRC